MKFIIVTTMILELFLGMLGFLGFLPSWMGGLAFLLLFVTRLYENISILFVRNINKQIKGVKNKIERVRREYNE